MSQSEWSGDSDDVIELAVQEMGQRMADQERRGKVPDHVLIKFLAEANKSADRRAAAKEREQSEEAKRDEVDVILATSLPWSKKKELLEAALERIEKRGSHIRELLQRGDTDE